MQVEAVPVDALVGEETLSRLFSGQLITSESGPEPSVLFFVFRTDQGALPECT
jgi:hypothetical protein